MDLHDRRCAVCRSDTPIISAAAAAAYATQVPGWEIREASIKRTFSFNNFAEALVFFNKVAAIAEAEDHHPDMCIQEWRKVSLSLTSHAAQGLTENDFIMAAKINALQ